MKSIDFQISQLKSIFAFERKKNIQQKIDENPYSIFFILKSVI